ncbi:unnamed protein product, partial [Heterosigma akashiwo]
RSGQWDAEQPGRSPQRGQRGCHPGRRTQRVAPKGRRHRRGPEGGRGRAAVREQRRGPHGPERHVPDTPGNADEPARLGPPLFLQPGRRGRGRRGPGGRRRRRHGGG